MHGGNVLWNACLISACMRMILTNRVNQQTGLQGLAQTDTHILSQCRHFMGEIVYSQMQLCQLISVRCMHMTFLDTCMLAANFAECEYIQANTSSLST